MIKLTQAILPVAGLGTRFLPWTKVVPKELLPIGNQPIIALLVDECLSIGISDICFVISRGKEAIPQYFYEMPELEKELHKRGKGHMLEELARYDSVNFHVAYQEEMKGDGHAILQARDWVKSEYVGILFGDDLIVGKKSGLEQLKEGLKHIQPTKDTAVICVQEVEKKLLSKYGVIDLDHAWSKENPHANLRRVKGLVEKPKPEDAPSNLGIVGKYIIPKSLIEKLHQIEEGSKDGEVRLIDGLIAQKKAY
jgi:UTP--glucose-1-phosphate uridylyltransferase